MRHTTVPKAISSTYDHAFNRFAVHEVGKGPCEKYSRQNIITIILIIAIIRILIRNSKNNNNLYYNYP